MLLLLCFTPHVMTSAITGAIQNGDWHRHGQRSGHGYLFLLPSSIKTAHSTKSIDHNKSTPLLTHLSKIALRKSDKSCDPFEHRVASSRAIEPSCLHTSPSPSTRSA